MDETYRDLMEEIKKDILTGEFQKGEGIIAEAMKQAPHSPIPHNLMGILLEKEKEPILAMRHFRVAYELDPTYRPARYNIELGTSFLSVRAYAFCEADCPIKRKKYAKMEFDEHEIGRIVFENESSPL